MKYQEINTNDSYDQEDQNFLEERKEMIEELFEKTEDYFKTNVTLLKLKALDKGAIAMSAMVANLAQLLLFLFFLLILSTGCAVWLGSAFGKIYLGFMLVAGFYAVLIMLYIIFFKSSFKKFINNRIISVLDK